MPESTPEALQQQIADLQQQLDTVRAQEGKDTAAPYERQEVKDALIEQIRQSVPGLASPTSGVIVPSDDASAPSYTDPALSPQVQQFVNVAFTQGVQAAIVQAQQTGNPALVDALHDILTDEFHQELLKRQKISPAM